MEKDLEAFAYGHGDPSVLSPENVPADPPIEGLDLGKLLTGDINRLRYVKRYGTSMLAHQENVAEHCYYVCLYSLIIADWCEEVQRQPISLSVLMTKVVLHDVDEARTGDFQRGFKYRTPGFKHEVDMAAREEFSTIMQQICGPKFFESQNYDYFWREAKDRTAEGRIVALADFLSVLSVLMSEARTANYTMAGLYDTLGEYADTFSDSSYDFLRPIVVEAQRIVTAIVSRAKKEMQW